MQQNS